MKLELIDEIRTRGYLLNPQINVEILEYHKHGKFFFS